MTTSKEIRHTCPGARGERRSPRFYTHAVVGKWDFERAMRGSTKSAHDDVQLNWDYNVVCADAQPGESYAKYRPGSSFEITEEMIAKSRAYFERYGRDFHRAVAKRLEEIKASITEARAKADALPAVLQWSMSERAALKACGTFEKRGHCEVRVLPVERHG